VPVVIVALLAGATLLPSRPGNSDHPWDLVGSIQVMVGLVGLTYAIKELAKRDPSWLAAGLAFAVGLLAMVVFVRRQLASRSPLIDFSLFANPRFSAGVATAMVASAALIGVELVFSQRLQLVLGLSPLQAGLVILPIPLAAFIAGPVTGLALPRIGAVRVLWSSLLLAGATLAAYLMVYRGETWLWLTALSAMGFGFGAAMTAASSVIMLSAPEERAGMAASIEEVSFELGGALGIAFLGSLMSALYTYALVLPNGIAAQAADSLDEALLIAERLGPTEATELTRLAGAAFDQAFVGVIAAAAALLILVSLVIWRRTATA
jgi:MFS transporter, DHA2 family, multidrug resistance protein